MALVMSLLLMEIKKPPDFGRPSRCESVIWG